MYTTINHRKSVTCHDLFVRPADEDYFVGRWALLNGVYPLAFWQLSQALEKYLKCSLVLNNVSVSKNGHNISALYESYRKIDDEICIQKFRKPDILHEGFWSAEEIVDFLNDLEAMGSPDARYGLVSWWRKKADLFKFDQLAFHFRRSTIGFDWKIGSDWPVQNETENAALGQS